MAGIKETKELVEGIIELGNATDKASRDGISVADIALFVPALMLLPEALAGIGEVKVEVADMDETEMNELKDAIKAKLDLVDDDLEALIEDSLSAGVVLYGIVKRIQAAKAV